LKAEESGTYLPSISLKIQAYEKNGTLPTGPKILPYVCYAIASHVPIDFNKETSNRQGIFLSF